MRLTVCLGNQKFAKGWLPGRGTIRFAIQRSAKTLKLNVAPILGNKCQWNGLRFIIKKLQRPRLNHPQRLRRCWLGSRKQHRAIRQHPNQNRPTSASCQSIPSRVWQQLPDVTR